MNKRALRTVKVTTAAADTYENLGSAIPVNMRRYVYQIKIVNTDAEEEKVTIADRLGEAAESEKNIWYVVTPYETIIQPSSLGEDAAPLYIFDASSSTANRMIRIKSATLGVTVTIWYTDEY